MSNFTTRACVVEAKKKTQTPPPLPKKTNPQNKPPKQTPKTKPQNKLETHSHNQGSRATRVHMSELYFDFISALRSLFRDVWQALDDAQIVREGKTFGVVVGNYELKGEIPPAGDVGAIVPPVVYFSSTFPVFGGTGSRLMLSKTGIGRTMPHAKDAFAITSSSAASQFEIRIPDNEKWSAGRDGSAEAGAGAAGAGAHGKLFLGDDDCDRRWLVTRIVGIVGDVVVGDNADSVVSYEESSSRIKLFASKHPLTGKIVERYTGLNLPLPVILGTDGIPITFGQINRLSQLSWCASVKPSPSGNGNAARQIEAVGLKEKVLAAALFAIHRSREAAASLLGDRAEAAMAAVATIYAMPNYHLFARLMDTSDVETTDALQNWGVQIIGLLSFADVNDFLSTPPPILDLESQGLEIEHCDAYMVKTPNQADCISKMLEHWFECALAPSQLIGRTARGIHELSDRRISLGAAMGTLFRVLGEQYRLQTELLAFATYVSCLLRAPCADVAISNRGVLVDIMGSVAKFGPEEGAGLQTHGACACHTCDKSLPLSKMLCCIECNGSLLCTMHFRTTSGVCQRCMPTVMARDVAERETRIKDKCREIVKNLSEKAMAENKRLAAELTQAREELAALTSLLGDDTRSRSKEDKSSKIHHARLLKQCEQQRADLATKTRELKSSEQTIEEMHDAMTSLAAANEALAHDLAKCRQESDGRQLAEKEMLEEERQQTLAECESLRSANDALGAANSKALAECESLQAANAALGAAKKKALAECESLRAANAVLGETCTRALAECKALRAAPNPSTAADARRNLAELDSLRAEIVAMEPTLPPAHSVTVRLQRIETVLAESMTKKDADLLKLGNEHAEQLRLYNQLLQAYNHMRTKQIHECK